MFRAMATSARRPLLALAIGAVAAALAAAPAAQVAAARVAPARPTGAGPACSNASCLDVTPESDRLARFAGVQATHAGADSAAALRPAVERKAALSAGT